MEKNVAARWEPSVSSIQKTTTWPKRSTRLLKIQMFFDRMSLTRRFMLASFVVLVLGIIGIGGWIQGQIEAGVIHRTGLTTALYVDSFIEPTLQSLANSPAISKQAIQSLDKLLNNIDFGSQFVAFKIWNVYGRILYSTNPENVGDQFVIKTDLAKSLKGEVIAEISDLSDEENTVDRQFSDHLIEVYVPVHELGSGQVIGVAEFYQRTDGLDSEIYASRWRSWLVFSAVAAIMYILLAFFVRNADHTLQEQQDELNEQIVILRNVLAENKSLNARVRRAAALTSALNERVLRSIGNELHDGPIQNLGLALLRVENINLPATGEEVSPSHPPNRDVVNEIKTALSHALQEMRAIASGVALPHLSKLTIEEATLRVVRAHERRTSTKVKVVTDSVDMHAPLPVKITLYRVIQEALNNAYRHAGGVGQEVKVARVNDEEIYLEICDQGTGFDMKQDNTWSDHLGLVGMRDRVESLGGLFAVAKRSNGAGTYVRAYIPLTVEDVAEKI